MKLEPWSGRELTESLVLVACHRRYHHYSERYYKDHEIADLESGAIMSKYIYVDISNLFVEACKKSDIEQVEYLISMGADVNRVDYHGRKAAVLVCASGNVQLMEVLLKHGADVDSFYEPAERDYMHDHDSDGDPHRNPHLGEDYCWYDAYDEFSDFCSDDTLLHIACPNDLPMMKLLLEHGADVNAINGNCDTPFEQAYEGRSASKQEAIDLLLDHMFTEASEDYDYNSHSPLHSACANADFPLIERMLHGADVNVIDEGTPLLMLLSCRFHRGDMEHIGMSSLVQCVKLLLEYGADVTAKDWGDKTVFDYVNAGSELEALLREHSVDRKPVLK